MNEETIMAPADIDVTPDIEDKNPRHRKGSKWRGLSVDGYFSWRTFSAQSGVKWSQTVREYVKKSTLKS